MNLRLGFIVIAGILLLLFPVYFLQVAARLLFFLVFASWILSALPRHYLSIHVERPVIRSFLHERSVVRLRIVNNSFIPLLHIAFKDGSGSLSIEGRNSLVTHIPAKSQVTLEYKIWSIHRGLYKIGPLTLISGDPFGLFPWTREFKMERLVFMYPHIAPMELLTNHGLTGGPVQSRHPMYLDTTQVRSLRQYQNGDDPRHIHWKASAAQGALMTTEYAKTLTIPFYVVLNLNIEDFGNRKRGYHVERCIEAAAAFIELSNFKRFSLGFLTNGFIPLETRKYLGLAGTESMRCFHMPISNGQQVASQILSILSVIQENPEHISLSEMCQHMSFSQNPRVLVISPPAGEQDYVDFISIIPLSCRIDFWFLDEHQSREGRIDHRAIPGRTRLNLYRLPEYGEEFLKEESKNG